jgi:predicted anti-sigma-YlaC factor YlaD
MRVLQFLAVVLTALALVPVGAHLFELPNKLGLAEEAYFTVQQIYRGWALFGVALFASIAANLAAGVVLLRHGRPSWPSWLAGLLIVVTLAIFFTWTYPANRATANWTAAPADWQALRRQWELSHAANAVVTFASLCCAALSLTIGRRDR